MRYSMWDDASPLRTSSDRLGRLSYFFQTVVTGTTEPKQVAPGQPCPLGEAFFMMLEAMIITAPRTREMGTWSIDDFSSVLKVLQDRVPPSGAVRSTWPIFGLLAIAQEGLLHFSEDLGTSTLPGLQPFMTICPAGRQLARKLQSWLRASAHGAALPSLGRAGGLAAKLHAGLQANPYLCEGDRVAKAAARLVLALFSASIHSLNSTVLVTGGLDDRIDAAVREAGGWVRLFFTGWPLVALMQRFQEAHFHDAFCSEAEYGAYGLLSRALPESFWICVRRAHDIVDERWRKQGVFDDCFYIKEAMQIVSGEGLFLDIGANLGSCTFAVAARTGMRVIAFEPMPTVARLLHAGVRRNGLQSQVEVLGVALGRESEAGGELHCSPGHSATCQVFWGPTAVQELVLDGAAGGVTADDGPPSRTPAPVAVRGTSLDAVLDARRDLPPLRGVKIDVEGAEEEVLLGGESTFRRYRPLLFLELHGPELLSRGSSVEKVFDLILDLGYTDFRPLSEDLPPSCGPTGEVRGNGIFPGERWIGTELLLIVKEVVGPCACSFVCYAQLQRGCRCWDFYEQVGHCRLSRECRLREDKDGFISGELNGLWQISAEIASQQALAS